MKNNLRCLCAAMVAGCLLSPLISHAQDGPGRWYLKGDVGGNWTGDTELKEFFGPVAPGSKVEFDPGLRMGVAGGYNFNEFFALEGELGFMGNSVDSITDAFILDADYANVPLLVNAKLKYPNNSGFTPYIAGGVGFSTSILDVEDLQIGTTYMSGSEADVVFAYQLQAGVRYDFNENMSVGVEYRYFWADGADWEADVIFYTLSDSMSIGDTDTHAVSLVFRFAF